MRVDQHPHREQALTMLWSLRQTATQALKMGWQGKEGAAHQDLGWRSDECLFQCSGGWSIPHLWSKWRPQCNHVQARENKNTDGAVAQWAAHLPNHHENQAGGWDGMPIILALGKPRG